MPEMPELPESEIDPEELQALAENGTFDLAREVVRLRSYALAAVEAERERCAKLCEMVDCPKGSDEEEHTYCAAALDCAAAIRGNE